MLFYLKLLFAGIWSYVFHWGVGFGLIGVCLFLALAGPVIIGSIPLIGPWLAKAVEPLSKQLIVAAVVIAVFMGGMWVGNQDATNRCTAKGSLVRTHVEDVVKGVNENLTPPKDKWEID